MEMWPERNNPKGSGEGRKIAREVGENAFNIHVPEGRLNWAQPRRKRSTTNGKGGRGEKKKGRRRRIWLQVLPKPKGNFVGGGGVNWKKAMEHLKRNTGGIWCGKKRGKHLGGQKEHSSNRPLRCHDAGGTRIIITRQGKKSDAWGENPDLEDGHYAGKAIPLRKGLYGLMEKGYPV